MKAAKSGAGKVSLNVSGNRQKMIQRKCVNLWALKCPLQKPLALAKVRLYGYSGHQIPEYPE